MMEAKFKMQELPINTVLRQAPTALLTIRATIKDMGPKVPFIPAVVSRIYAI